MAKSREAKNSELTELVDLLGASKLTVVAQYSGMSVSQMQELKSGSKESETQVLVAKNRLVKLAASKVDGLKETDLSALTGQLLYAFNSADEVAPAQALNTFAKNNPQLQFVGAISETGEFLDAEQVKALANLPSKEQLRGQLVGVLAAPLSGLVGVLGGNMRGLVTLLNARKEGNTGR